MNIHSSGTFSMDSFSRSLTQPHRCILLKKFLSGCALLLALVAPLSQADLDVTKAETSIVRVVIGGHGTGWVVSPGVVATNWHVAEGNEVFDIIPAGTSDVYRGTARWIGNDNLDIALLDVPDLPLPPLTIRTADTTRGTEAYTVGFPGLGDDFTGRENVDVSVYGGTVALVVENVGGVRIIQHTTIVNAGNSGGPLMDDCGRVLGLTTWGREREGVQADFIWASVHVGELAEQMDRLNIPYTTDNSPCTTIPSTAGATISDEDLAALAERLAAEGNQLRLEFASLVESRNSDNLAQLHELSTQLQTWGTVLAVALAITLLLALRKPRQRIVHALDQMSRVVGRTSASRAAGESARSAASNTKACGGLVISGVADGGATLRVLLPRNILENYMKGLSIGRDADIVDFSFASQSISRRHARFRWRDGKVHIEDLNSTNGTFVNGRQLDPFNSTPLNVGDSLKVGDTVLIVSKLEEG